jgi:peptide-methionine (S)-S-oxide reductase
MKPSHQKNDLPDTFRTSRGQIFLRGFIFFLLCMMVGCMDKISEAKSATESAGNEPANLSRATLGGGCFWCVEAVYERLPGVHKVISGYAGGHIPNPSYKQVTEGTTGHAEVVQIFFDPAIVTFREIIDLFWEAHDPTTLNRQGADVGTQYRSIILFHEESQKTEAEASMAAAQARFANRIVTELVPLEEFYLAEGYHQDFYRLNQSHPYCSYVIRPKLKKLAGKLSEQ